ncbi:MAG: YigZ family protein [Bacteroidota bacterium]|nr:YigZ family protein [Bacteroidota bacterium]MDP4206073.1 YigZ family protein [Bacteroidota bacterium]
MSDTYRTIRAASEGLFKDKGSRFIAYAFPVYTEEEIREHVNRLKKEHHAARHHCYAWRLGAENQTFRANDDGEPSGTAGKPILGQIQSFDLTNILVVVVRYFGGTLLGVSGLINAYRSATIEVINNSEIISCIVEDVIKVEYDYLNMNEVMRIVKDESLEIISTQFDLKCVLKISVRQSESERITEMLNKLIGVKAEPEGTR